MFSIRTATKADATTLSEAERQTAQTPGLLASRPGEISVERTEGKIEAMVARGRYLVAEVDGSVVGHGLLEPLGELASIAHVYMLTMVVHPGRIGQGVGTALLGHLLDWAAKDDRVLKVELRVRSTNARAIALYEKFGFVFEGRLLRRIRFEDGSFVDDLSMAWFPGSSPVR